MWLGFDGSQRRYVTRAAGAIRTLDAISEGIASITVDTTCRWSVAGRETSFVAAMNPRGKPRPRHDLPMPAAIQLIRYAGAKTQNNKLAPPRMWQSRSPRHPSLRLAVYCCADRACSTRRRPTSLGRQSRTVIARVKRLLWLSRRTVSFPNSHVSLTGYSAGEG